MGKIKSAIEGAWEEIIVIVMTLAAVTLLVVCAGLAYLITRMPKEGETQWRDF